MKTAERRAGEWKRVELQLDTAQILLVIAMLLGLCAVSFYLGRWMERDRWQEISGREAPAKNSKVSETDAGADLTFFDTLGSRTAEPARQARSAPTGKGPSSSAPRVARTEADTAEGPDEAASGRASEAAPSRSSPPPPASSTASSSSGPVASSWAVQVFAGDRSQAERVISSLARKGYSARLVPGASGPRNTRVRVVGYRTRAEAQQGADRLRREEKLKPWVVKAD